MSTNVGYRANEHTYMSRWHCRRRHMPLSSPSTHNQKQQQRLRLLLRGLSPAVVVVATNNAAVMEYLRLCGQLVGGIPILLQFSQPSHGAGALMLHRSQCSALEQAFSGALERATALIRRTLPLPLPWEESPRGRWRALERALKELYCVLRDGELFIRSCILRLPVDASALSLADASDAAELHLHNLMWALSVVHDAVEAAAEAASSPDECRLRRVLHLKKYDNDLLLSPKLFLWHYGHDYLVTPLTLCFPTGIADAEAEAEAAAAAALRQKLEPKQKKLVEFLVRRLRHRSHGHECVACLEMESRDVQVKRRIGSGRFGEVKEVAWLGEALAMRHMFTNADVFVQEFSRLSRLRHPNILQALGYVLDRERNECSILMELVPRDLRSFVSENFSPRKRAPFGLATAVEIMFQVARGMEYLHSQGIIHGNLKASNVLVSTGPNEGQFQVRVSDHGLIRSNLMSSRFSTQQQQLQPCSWWRAPEVANVRPEDEAADGVFPKRYSQKSDVYSFGMLCYEILTGKIPCDDAHAKSDIAKIKSGEKPLLPVDLPRYLSGFIKKCWANDPRCRPTFAAACRALRHIKRKVLVSGADDATAIADVLEMDLALEKRLPDWANGDFSAAAANIPFQLFAFRVMETDKILRFNLAAAAGVKMAKQNHDENTAAENLEAVIQALKLKLPMSPRLILACEGGGGGASADSGAAATAATVRVTSGSPLLSLPRNRKVAAMPAPTAKTVSRTRPAVRSKLAKTTTTTTGGNVGERRRGRSPSVTTCYWSN